MDATLSEVLKPYNRARIAEHVGVNRSTVRAWAHGETSPGSDKLPLLADILRIDLGTLATIVAQDSKRRESAQIARVG